MNTRKLQTIGPGIALNSKTIALWKVRKTRQHTREDGTSHNLIYVFNHKYHNNYLNSPIKRHLVKRNRTSYRRTQVRAAAITIYRLSNTRKEIVQISLISAKWRKSRRASMEASQKSNLKIQLCSTKRNLKVKAKYKTQKHIKYGSRFNKKTKMKMMIFLDNGRKYWSWLKRTNSNRA